MMTAMRRLLGVALALAGCLKPSSTTCPEGWTCPDGLACAPAGVFCAAKADLDACAASTIDAHDACSTADIGSGVCIAKVCRACETDYEGCSVPAWAPMGYTGDELKGVWLTDRRTAIAVGKAGAVARYDGIAWTTVSVSTLDYIGVATADKPYALYSSEVDAVGSAAATSVHTAPAGATYRGIWAAGSDAYAVGNMGTISRYDGAAWTDTAVGSGAPSFIGVGGSSPTDVWAVGGGGAVWHATNGTFAQVMGIPVLAAFRAVWSSSPTDVFVVGPSVVVHFDGAQWTQQTLPVSTTIGLLGVWGSGPTDVWTVGNDASGIGQIFHYDGTQWTTAASGQPTLDAIMGVGNDVFAVGKSIVLRYSP